MPRVATAMPAENQPSTLMVLRSLAWTAWTSSACASVSGASSSGSVDIDSKPPERRIAQFRAALFPLWEGLMMISLHAVVVGGKQTLLLYFGKKTGANGVGRELPQL